MLEALHQTSLTKAGAVGNLHLCLILSQTQNFYDVKVHQH